MRLTPEIKNTGGYFLVLFSLGIAAASLGPTLPALAEQTRTQLGEISFLFSARSLGYVSGSWLSGKLYDIFPGNRLLAGMLLAITACLLLTPLIDILWILAGVLFLIGAAEGSLDVGSNTLLVWVHGNKVGPYMNALHFFFGAGAFVSPLLIGRIFVSGSDLRTVYWMLALLMVPSLLWIAPLSSPRIRKSAPEEQRTGVGVPRVFLLIIGLFFLYVGAEMTFGGWIYTYVLEMGIGGIAAAAAITSAFWGAFTIGRLLAIPLATVMRPRNILTIALAGALASCLLFAVFPGSRLVAWVMAIGFGLFMAPLFPTLMTLTERRLSITGSLTGWLFMGIGLGGTTIPWIVGQLFERFGPPALLWILVVDLILAFVVLRSVIVSVIVEEPVPDP